MNVEIKTFLLFVLTCFIFCQSVFAEDGKPMTPPPDAKCPVCGMFVSKYPDWVGQVQFTDGKRVFFDGAKDLFKFYFGLKQYQPGKTTKDIKAIFVTEYYSVQPIEARVAFFVIGSDVLGPMGRELIPLASMKDAEEFKADHQGKRIVKFEEVDLKIIQSLD
jgi:copper chaperone NosL